LIIGVTRGRLDVWNVFYLLALIVWLSSVFFAYQLAGIYFEDRYSPFFAAFFLVFYPAFALNFYGVKISHINVPFLLAGIFVFEKKIRYLRAHLQFAFFAALFFLGLFAVGGWAFLFVYVFFRNFSLPREQRLGGLVSAILALLVAQITLGYLRELYQLPSAEQQMSYSYGESLSSSAAWVWAFARGENVEALRFLGYTGLAFFTEYLPLIIGAFVRGHWTLLLLAIGAMITIPKTRMLLVIAFFLFFIGHGGYTVTGWIWHYGYVSAPAAVITILAASGFLGWTMSNSQPNWKALALLLAVLTLFVFMNRKVNAALYYSGYTERYQPRIILYYGETNETAEH
jgi:hypothetical protein